MIKTNLLVASTLIGATLLTACSTSNSSSSSQASSSESFSSSEEILSSSSSMTSSESQSSSSLTSSEIGSETSSSTESGSNALVIYFSATNHTEAVATTIAEYISSPIHELEPVDPYTSEDLSYSNRESRVVQEYLDENRHVELVTTSYEEFADAQYIFLGAPVWWQQLSWVINDFVSDNDFTGKTVIPFGTSASSGFSTDDLVALAEGKGTWLDGQRFSSRASTETIHNLVDSLGFSF